ncbi:hypothetical protein RDn1_351, partial [Candidatus Termititenax dinenymphae]
MKNNFWMVIFLLSICLARDPFLPPESGSMSARNTSGMQMVNHYRTVSLNYLAAEDAAKMIEKLYPDAMVCAEKNNNILLLGADLQTEKILAALRE